LALRADHFQKPVAAVDLGQFESLSPSQRKSSAELPSNSLRDNELRARFMARFSQSRPINAEVFWLNFRYQ
jgi:hypothetical protein